MKINFYPESDLDDYNEAVSEYEKIWEDKGSKILESWERHSGLKFRETFINAIVFDGISMSHPLSLGYNKLPDGRLAILAHEMGHRILYKRVSGMGKSSLNRHKFLDLIFYFVLQELFGDQTKRIIEWESNRKRTDQYKIAWDWALKFNDEEKKTVFNKILAGDLSSLD